MNTSTVTASNTALVDLHIRAFRKQELHDSQVAGFCRQVQRLRSTTLANDSATERSQKFESAEALLACGEENR